MAVSLPFQPLTLLAVVVQEQIAVALLPVVEAGVVALLMVEDIPVLLVMQAGIHRLKDLPVGQIIRVRLIQAVVVVVLVRLVLLLPVAPQEMAVPVKLHR
jgi:hypothetical protein